MKGGRGGRGRVNERGDGRGGRVDERREGRPIL